MVKMAASAAQTIANKFSKEMAISLTKDLLKQCEAVQNEYQGIVDSVGQTSKRNSRNLSIVLAFV